MLFAYMSSVDGVYFVSISTRMRVGHPIRPCLCHALTLFFFEGHSNAVRNYLILSLR